MDAHNKVCFVVGAASGMGRLAAQRWARAGGIVAAADVNEEGLRETAADCDSIQAFHLDVTNRQEVESVVKTVESEVGPIERVFSCAAIMPTALLLSQDPDEIHRVMNINYGGTVNVSLATLPRLLERGRGALINFASIAGWTPTLHFGAYNASKFALEAFTESLAQEVKGHGIRVALVEPGIIDTAMATTNLPQYDEKTIYPHGRRIHAFFTNPAKGEASPALVGEMIRYVIESDDPRLRFPVGPDALPFLG